MFKHFGAKHDIKEPVFRNVEEVADDVDARKVPFAHLQATIISAAIILRNILGDIIQTAAIFLVLAFTCSNIEK